MLTYTKTYAPLSSRRAPCLRPKSSSPWLSAQRCCTASSKSPGPAPGLFLSVHCARSAGAHHRPEPQSANALATSPWLSCSPIRKPRPLCRGFFSRQNLCVGWKCSRTPRRTLRFPAAARLAYDRNLLVPGSQPNAAVLPVRKAPAQRRGFSCPYTALARPALITALNRNPLMRSLRAHGCSTARPEKPRSCAGAFSCPLSPLAIGLLWEVRPRADGPSPHPLARGCRRRVHAATDSLVAARSRLPQRPGLMA